MRVEDTAGFPLHTVHLVGVAATTSSKGWNRCTIVLSLCKLPQVSQSAGRRYVYQWTMSAQLLWLINWTLHVRFCLGYLFSAYYSVFQQWVLSAECWSTEYWVINIQNSEVLTIGLNIKITTHYAKKNWKQVPIHTSTNLQVPSICTISVQMGKVFGIQTWESESYINISTNSNNEGWIISPVPMANQWILLVLWYLRLLSCCPLSFRYTFLYCYKYV